MYNDIKIKKKTEEYFLKVLQNLYCENIKYFQEEFRTFTKHYSI